MSVDKGNCKITGLSDCLMMTILSYLDATTLYNLSRTCNYFQNIIEDDKLWRYVDARNEPNSDEKVQYCCQRISKNARQVYFKAQSKKIGVVPQDFIRTTLWHLKHLTVVSLENQRFNGKTVFMSYFPMSLEELSLKRTQIKNGKLFFQHSCTKMQNLRVLILDECNWLDSSFIMSVSKYPNLEILSIIKCYNLHHNIVPYLGVASAGCKKLKVLDCRFSMVANDFLRQAFDRKDSILALYFQSMRSYQIYSGKPLFKNMDQMDNLTPDELDLNRQSVVNNNSLSQFEYFIGGPKEALPKSVLYEDPYPGCTCKYANDIKEELEKEKQLSMKFDDFVDYHSSTPQRFICRRHLTDLQKLPVEFRDFFIQNQRQFHPDSESDSESDSDSDGACCLFGMGVAPKILVLKLRGVDGNMESPEVISVWPNGENESNIINVDIFAEQRNRENDNSVQDHENQPGISHENKQKHENIDSNHKRKNSTSDDKTESKRIKLDEPGTSKDVATPSSSFKDDMYSNKHKPGTSKNHTNEIEIKIVPRTNSEQRSEPSTSKNNKPEASTLKGKELDGSKSSDEMSSEERREKGNKEESEDSDEIPAGPEVLQDERLNIENIQEEPIHNRQIVMFEYLRGIFPWMKPRELRLRRLSLRGYRKITDEALKYIKHLNIDLLDVMHTSITKEGIEEYLTYNPECRVLHKDFCVCKPKIPI